MTVGVIETPHILISDDLVFFDTTGILKDNYLANYENKSNRSSTSSDISTYPDTSSEDMGIT
jgi:hypothetical protein